MRRSQHHLLPHNLSTQRPCRRWVSLLSHTSHGLALCLTQVLADLPGHLVAKVCAYVLERTQPRGELYGTWDKPLGSSTARLQQAITLAAVCKQWRQAAVQAWRTQERSLNYQHPASDMPPQYLSSLLAELLEGCKVLTLDPPLLASPEAAAFLQVGATALTA